MCQDGFDGKGGAAFTRSSGLCCLVQPPAQLDHTIGPTGEISRLQPEAIDGYRPTARAAR